MNGIDHEYVPATALLDFNGRYLGCWWVTPDGHIRVMARQTTTGISQTILLDSPNQAKRWLQEMARFIK